MGVCRFGVGGGVMSTAKKAGSGKGAAGVGRNRRLGFSPMKQKPQPPTPKFTAMGPPPPSGK